MTPQAFNQTGPLGFEELAWTLFEHLAADELLIYRASETGSLFEPALALGALSLSEKQFFWASQLDPAADPTTAQWIAPPAETFISSTLSCENRQPILDHLRAKSWLIYPLANRQVILGVILVGWFSAEVELLETQRKLARVITRSMALETDTARLYDLTHQQRQQARIAQETTQAILRRDALPDTLALIAHEAMRAVDALGCSIHLLDDAGQALLAVQVGQPVSVSLDLVGALDGAGQAMLIRQTPFVYPLEGEAVNEAERGLLLVAPLLSSQKTVGFLELLQMEAYHQPRDMATAGAFADQAAVAVELDRLYQRLQQTAVAEERARLARDLHDSISQSIYAMTLYTRAARRQLEEGNMPAVDQHLGALHTTAREVLGEMRLLIYELRPLALERYGLKGILEQRLQSVESRSGLETSLELDLPDALPPLVEENLYHIALEALNNIIKHAQASRVWVTIQQDAGKLFLSIHDDGVGFDPAGEAQGGLGLKSIRERVAMLNGQFEIAAQPGAGVTISVEVPYGEHPNSDR